MKYSSIYKNGKPDYFFIKADNPKEFNFIQPYFLVTSSDHPRKGSIKSMECLFSGSVWYGKQSHGCGYSSSADVYNTLISIIKALYNNKLSDKAIKELNNINTHDDEIKLSRRLLDELSALNIETLNNKYND